MRYWRKSVHFTWQTSPQSPHTGTAASDTILEISHNEGVLHVSILITWRTVGCFNKRWATFYTSSQFDTEFIYDNLLTFFFSVYYFQFVSFSLYWNKNTREQQHGTDIIFIISLKSHILYTHVMILHISISFCRESPTDFACSISTSRALLPVYTYVKARASNVLFHEM